MVELTIEKPDGSPAYVTNEGGGPQRQARSLIASALQRKSSRRTREK